jgi:hypothetical protein
MLSLGLRVAKYNSPGGRPNGFAKHFQARDKEEGEKERKKQRDKECS